MSRIDLPRALKDYFAFAEIDATRHGRRFSITLPYLNPDGRVDRLQWWYHLSPAHEKGPGDSALAQLRSRAIERFSLHIELWLQNTRQVLLGLEAIPQVQPDSNASLAHCVSGLSTPETADSASSVVTEEAASEMGLAVASDAHAAPNDVRAASSG